MHRRRDLSRHICLATALTGARARHGRRRPDPVATLSAWLRITAEQATRGAGAVFRPAAQRPSPTEFSIIAASGG